MTIGDQIKVIRKGRGYATASKLAKDVECNPETIRRIESGRSEASTKMLRKISEVLDYPFIVKA